jgi:pimeloyl-ACP methyl ester carboxylesterase
MRDSATARAFTVDAALGARWPGFLAALERAARADAELAAFGFSECRFDVRVGEQLAAFRSSDGNAFDVRAKGANPSFTLSAPVEVWKKFFSPVPPPFYHAVYAMKMRVPEFKVTGDELALAQSIHLVRRLLEIGREVIHGVPAERISKRRSTKEGIRGGYVRVELDGRPNRLYYEEAGRGRDLLCLHTAGSDSRQFCHLMADARLAARWRMVAFDMPWHGKSLPPEGGLPGEWRLNTARYVAAIEAVIRALELKRPVLLGSSMAGQICLEMALRASLGKGGRLGGVIACEASDRIEGRAVPLARHPLINQATFVPEWVHGLMAPQSPRSRAREIWWEYSQGGYGAFWGDIRFYSHDWDARGRVGRIDTRKCPVIMLTGEYDYSCTPEISRATAAKIPGAQFEVMKGLGHFPMAENPALFLRYLRPALARLRARRGG